MIFSDTHDGSILVVPPFYLRWWFIAVIVGIGWIILVYRARIVRLKNAYAGKEKTTLQLRHQAQVSLCFSSTVSTRSLVSSKRTNRLQ